jgi:hypothetical protein
MTMHRTPAEVEREYIAAMGDELGTLFYRCWNEGAWLHLKWGEYLILFGTKSERVQLLNRTAPSFFRVVQDSLWEDLLLHLCRLTDPPHSVGKENLTVQRLPALVADVIRPTVQETLKRLIDQSEFARDWRRRHIAHRDLALALAKTASPLAAATREGFKNALGSLVSLLNAVEGHYKNATTAYNMVSPSGNAEALLCVLRDGLDAEEERRRRFRSGKLLPEDIKGQPAV